MNERVTKLGELIESSRRIFITAHISPDPDAVSSAILLLQTLKLNYPDKAVAAVIEEEPSGLDFLPGYENLKFGEVARELQVFKPDLFILLDGNNFERCSRHSGEAIRQFIKDNQIKTVIIDHHEENGKDDADVFINRLSPAVVQDIYEICFDGLGLKKPKAAAQLTMAGFYADTGGFVYVKAGQQDRVFGFAERLVTDGADIEAVKNRLESFSEDDMKVIAQLAANVNHSSDYTYSFLSDEFIESWLKDGHTYPEMQRATNQFLNGYIRNIGGRRWGFITYKNALQGENYYSVSFRSEGGVPDVSVMAAALGGGGHKPAAGAKFEAGSLDDAIAKIRDTISGAVTGT